MTSSQATQVDPVLVREALHNLLQSTFVPEGSVLATMLSYVVERTLAGDSRSIKAYTIAVDAFGRSPDFNPDRDSTVRVTAMRLRAALDLYYAGPGALDRLRIRMVPGSYRPTFEAMPTMAQTPSPGTPSLAPAPSPVATRGGTAVPAPVPPVPARNARTPALAGWLAALTVVLAVDVAMTASLLANQTRGEAQAPSEIAEAAPTATLPAEKPFAHDPLLDLIQRDIQRSFQRPIE